jgi:acetyltransferase-like isoleucine patch superfamily enzyme
MTDINHTLSGEYLTPKELADLGFKELGSNVKISRNILLLGAEKIRIGNNVRIDDFCTINVTGHGFLDIGNYVHIAGYSYISCSNSVTFGNFSGVSQGVRIYTSSDDYSGNSLTNPTVPEKYRSAISGPVTLGDYVIIGSGSIVLPNVICHEGVAVGALSLVTRNLEAWSIYSGMPLKKLKPRSRKAKDLASHLLTQMEQFDQ